MSQSQRRIQTRRTTEPGDPVDDDKWDVLADTGPISQQQTPVAPPVAMIIPSATTVTVGQTVTLDGSQGAGTSHKWSQPHGTTVTLTSPGPDKAIVTFVAPANSYQGVPIDHVLGFSLTTKDPSGNEVTASQEIKVLGSSNSTAPPSPSQQPPPPETQSPQEPLQSNQDPTQPTENKPTPNLFTADVINHSSKITIDQLETICTAIKKQMDRDVASYWSYTASFNFGDPVQGNVKLGIFDQKDASGAAGWHAAQGDQVTIECYYVSTYEDLCTTISHEMLETIADYNAQTIVDGFDEEGTPVKAYLEIADPVEDDSYDVDGIQVSNFASPGWFSMPAHGGTPDSRTDYMEKTRKAWDIAPGGYMQYSYDGGKTWQDVEERKKFDELSGTRKAKRAARREQRKEQ